MTDYSLTERYLARLLSRAPLLKRIAKYFYTRISFYLNRTSERSYSQRAVEVIVPEKNSFFGYFDKSPESESGQILVHSTALNTKKLPDPNIPIDIVLLSSEKNELLRVPTRAYNWQQGARLQWLTNDLFVFNDFVNDKYVARLFSAKKMAEVEVFPMPIQDGWKDKYFLSINYERLNVLRPDYGYRNKKPMKDCSLKSLENDGIWHVDMKSHKVKLLIKLSSLAAEIGNPESLHKVNHISICPGGDHFVFLHRYLIKGRRFDRLILSSIDGKNLKVLSDGGMVSHYCWVSNSELVGFLRGPNGQDAYWKIDVATQNIEKLDVCEGLGDGHPSYRNNLIVTDTYPDKSRMQKLILFDLASLKEQKLGSFFHSLNFWGEARCDLHPRFGKTGDYVYFDSVFDGNRRLYRIKIDI